MVNSWRAGSGVTLLIISFAPRVLSSPAGRVQLRGGCGAATGSSAGRPALNRMAAAMAVSVPHTLVSRRTRDTTGHHGSQPDPY